MKLVICTFSRQTSIWVTCLKILMKEVIDHFFQLTSTNEMPNQIIIQ